MRVAGLKWNVPVYYCPTVCNLPTPKPARAHHQSLVLVVENLGGDSETSGCISWSYHTVSKDSQWEKKNKKHSSHNQVKPKGLCNDTLLWRAQENTKVQWATSQIAHYVPAALRSLPLKSLSERKTPELLQVSWKTEKWIFLQQKKNHIHVHICISTDTCTYTHVYG